MALDIKILDRRDIDPDASDLGGSKSSEKGQIPKVVNSGARFLLPARGKPISRTAHRRDWLPA